MTRVLRELNQAEVELRPETVHALRVALRRCRSIADGFMALDPGSEWKLMKKRARRLFRLLGDLRDIQVMKEWARRLSPSREATGVALMEHLDRQEDHFGKCALEEMHSIDRKQWGFWMGRLAERSARIAGNTPVFPYIALERWSEAHALHLRALRNRSFAAYHQLRIGLKRFRYTTENFLPELYASWEADLREMQDLLGEIHDLHMLLQTARSIGAFPNATKRQQWQQRISSEISCRLDKYRRKMMGKSSLAWIWRSALPARDQLQSAGMERLRIWASFLNPDFTHSKHVAEIALQIFDGLNSLALIPKTGMDSRRLLEAAALLHEVGAAGGSPKYHRNSYRQIRKLSPPLGWKAAEMRHVALIVRFHRGALPRLKKKAFSNISAAHAEMLLLLCGILRIADIFDSARAQPITRIQAKSGTGFIQLAVAGGPRKDISIKKLSSARYLLESFFHLPVLIQ